MIKKPLDIPDIPCLYCGLTDAVWSVDLESGLIKMTVPLCNACSNWPEILLTDQLMPKPKLRKRRV